MKTIQSACICSQLLPLLLCGGGALGQSLASHRMGQPERPPWVESDARLKVIGNVNFQGVTLGSAVESLTSQTKVPLEVSPHLKDCRISIFTQSRPLSEILMRIQDLFHHGSPLSYHTCYWLRIADKGAPVTYLLTQSRLGLAEEEENAGVPVQKLAKYLRQTRQYIGIAPEKRRKFKSDFPFLNNFAQRGEEVGGEDCGTMCDLVGSLTDAEIEMLASTGRVDVPSFVVAPSRLDALIKDAKTSGSYRSNMEQPPSQAYLLFKPQKKHGWYSLELYFGAGCVSTSSTGLSFDTLDNAGEPIWVSTMLEAMERGVPVIWVLPTCFRVLTTRARFFWNC